MSEDIDVTVPGTPTRYQSTNARLINEVVHSLDAIGPEVGIELVNLDGTSSEKGAHAIWEVRYPSSFIPEARRSSPSKQLSGRSTRNRAKRLFYNSCPLI